MDPLGVSNTHDSLVRKRREGGIETEIEGGGIERAIDIKREGQREE
jgi:hypothetical protein